MNAAGQTSYVNGTGYGYRYLLPQAFNPNVKYPAIIFLHGDGESGTDNALQLTVRTNSANGAMALVSTANPNNRQNYPCFFICPQKPVGSIWSSDVSATAVQNILTTMETLYPNAFDTTRIYITGLSDGGTGSYDMPYLLEQSNHLGFNPFAAIVPMSASFGYYIPRPVDTQPMVPTWAFHAADDPDATIAGSDDYYVPAMRALGFSILYTRYNTGGHAIWELAYQHPQLLPWLFSQSLGQPVQEPLANFYITAVSEPTSSTLNLSGTAATSVLPFNGLSWSNPANGQSGSASGSPIPTWSITDIPVTPGTNDLQITATAPNNTALVFGVATDYGGSFSVNLPYFMSPNVNIALNRPVTVSSAIVPQLGGQYAVDGNTQTRWSSNYTDNEWIDVDLGANYNISEVDLNWESACGKNYQIQTSTDNVNWTTQTYVTGNYTPGLLTYGYSSQPTARYVRMLGTARETIYGYSLYEFSVYSNQPSTPVPPPTPAPPPVQTILTDVALNKTVTVSSTEVPAHSGPNAVDGNTTTRWSSLYTNNEWIVVDLGANYSISEIDLDWETASGKNYQIQTSLDGLNWTTQNNVVGNTASGLLAYPYATPVTGRYVRMLGTLRNTQYGFSLWELYVYSGGTTTTPPPPPPPSLINLALKQPVTVSSTEVGPNVAANAVDGSTTTRWSSLYTDPQWIDVNLGANYNISEIDLNWETACGKNYVLQTSTDNVNWTTVTTVTGNTSTGLLKYSYSTPVSGHYVRMYGTARATTWGYSLWEFSVYGDGTLAVVNQAPAITNGPPPATGTIGTAYNFSFTDTGTPAPTFSVTSGSLPPGLNLSSTGVITGTPTTAGGYTATVDATNGTAPDATQTFTITVSPAAQAPAITNGPPPTTGTIGTAYNFTYTDTGTPAPTFSVTSGSLPPGLILSSTGVITGTPTTAGGYTATIDATNGTTPDSTQTFTITINPAVVVNQAPAITNGPPPTTGTIGTAYNFSFTDTGTPTPTFSVTSGSLPPGLNLSSTGVITGTPTTAGGYTATIDATNGTASDATQTFTITISPAVVNQAPAITNGPPPTTGTIGTAYNFSYTDTGTPTPTFSVTSGSLPPGLNLSSTGVLTGTPTTAGGYTATVDATNGTTPDATQTFTITISPAVVVNQPPAITNGPPPTTGTIGTAYNFSFTDTGTPAPTFSVTSGSLPPGLNLSTTGVITGTPTTAGGYTATVGATNGTTPDATQTFTITISPAVVVNQAPAITNGPPPTTGTIGTAYNFSYTDTGTPTPTFSVTSGSLPPGLNLSSTGVLTGTPTTAGSYTATIDATNGTAPDAIQTFTITISPAAQAPAITNGPPPTTGTVAVSYNFSYAVTGTPAPTFSVTSGGLPPGLNLSSTGVISGTPTSVGTFSGTITASNGVNPAATQNFSITVGLQPAPGTNLALGQSVTVSSTETGPNVAANAVDGNNSTRWSSLYSDPQWIVVDLGADYAISEVDLNWETACGKNYQIQSSLDKVNWTTLTTVTGNTSTGLLQYPYSSPTVGRYVRMYGTARATQWGYSLWEFAVYGTLSASQTPPPTIANLALNQPVTISSTDGNVGPNAVDGNTSTRWSSAYSDNQWIVVDLGAVHTITEVDLNWEAACGKNYQIQTSTDDVNWTTQTNVTGNTSSGVLKYPYATSLSARYVRMLGTARATTWGYSLWEFTVLGQ